MVVFLSTFLAIFLFISIVVLLKLNKILGHISSITAKAESIADQAGNVASFFNKTASSVALGKLLANVVNVASMPKEKKKR